MRQRILCIEDDVTIQALVHETLKEYHVVKALTLAQAESELNKSDFHAILLDVELPDGDGLKFFAKIGVEPKFKRTPTLILTGNGDISNKVMAFTLGAEDFISKPFHPMELQARLSAKIRKIQALEDGHRARLVGDIEIDFDRQMAIRVVNGSPSPIELTAIEFKILVLLTKRMEQVFSREQILRSIWSNTNITDRTIDSHMAHLRSKLVHSRVEIGSVRNFGYRATLKL